MEDEIIDKSTDTSAGVATDELMRELDKGTKTMAGLDGATRRAVMVRLNAGDVIADEGEVTSVDEKPDAKPDDKTAEADATLEDAAPKLSPAETRRKIQSEADEANRLEQKLKSQQGRRERAKAELEEFQKSGIKKPEDAFDETHQTSMYERLQKAEKQLEIMARDQEDSQAEEITRTEASLQTKKENAVFGEFEDLQAKYPDLKTTKPFRTLNADYAAFIDNLVEQSGVKTLHPEATPEVLRKAAMDKFNTEPEFAKTLKFQLPAEMDKLSVLLKLNHAKATKGGSLRANYLEMLDESGTLEEVLQMTAKKAGKAATRATVDAIKGKETEIQTITPDDGTARAGYTQPTMTYESAEAIIRGVTKKQEAGQKLTVGEKANMTAANLFMRTRVNA